MFFRVLFVSPSSEHADALQRMLDRISIPCDHAGSVDEARGLLRGERYGVVLTESELPDGIWLDVLGLAHQSGSPPKVIVTRSAVDERFWAEVLNLGGDDMLVQPFSEAEVQRVLFNACARAA